MEPFAATLWWSSTLIVVQRLQGNLAGMHSFVGLTIPVAAMMPKLPTYTVYFFVLLCPVLQVGISCQSTGSPYQPESRNKSGRLPPCSSWNPVLLWLKQLSASIGQGTTSVSGSSIRRATVSKGRYIEVERSIRGYHHTSQALFSSIAFATLSSSMVI